MSGITDRERSQPERLDYFAVVGVRFGRRSNVREDLDPYLRLDLLSQTAPPAELRLTFRDALDLIRRITDELATRTERADINAALGRTKPLSTEEVIAHERGT